MQWLSGAELGDTQPEVEKAIEAYLVSEIKKHAETFVQPDTFLKNASNKWRAASAMQKSIRQGDGHVAVRMAHALLGLDPKYVWRRLCTVAIEDIGVGDVRLTAAMMWVAGKEKWRIAQGGDPLVLSTIVTLLSAAPKDRHACDLLVWADLAPELAERRAELSAMAKEKEFYELAYMLLDESVMLAERMIAAWCFVGTRSMPGARFDEFDGMGIKALSELVRNDMPNLPEVVSLTMRWAANKQYEGMPMAYPLVYQLARKSCAGKPVSVKGDDLVGLPMIGNYPSSAFDMHNHEGKRAISYFVKCCPPLHKFLSEFIDPDDMADKHKMTEAVGTLIFRVEGHQVKPRLYYDGMQDLLDLAEFAHLQGNFVPGVLADTGMTIVRANMPLLHHARCRILGIESVAPEVATIDPFDKSVVLEKGITTSILGKEPLFNLCMFNSDPYLQPTEKFEFIGADYAALEEKVIANYIPYKKTNKFLYQGSVMSKIEAKEMAAAAIPVSVVAPYEGAMTWKDIYPTIAKKHDMVAEDLAAYIPTSAPKISSATKAKNLAAAYSMAASKAIKVTEAKKKLGLSNLAAQQVYVLEVLQDAVANQLKGPQDLGPLDDWVLYYHGPAKGVPFPMNEVVLWNPAVSMMLAMKVTQDLAWELPLADFKKMLFEAMIAVYNGEGLYVPLNHKKTF